MNEKELMGLKQKIDKTKIRMAEDKGRKEYLMQELAEKYNCETIREAKKIQIRMTTDIKELDGQIEKGIEQIEKEYDV